MKKYTLILDVDGVFTDGTFYYTKDGKVAKKFGPDDNEAMSLALKNEKIAGNLNIMIMSGDRRAFHITQKRVADMGFDLIDVPGGEKRLEWIRRNLNPDEVIYMGDGLRDAHILKNVAYGISTSTSSFLAQKYSDYITKCEGGHRAVSEAIFHIAEKFFGVTPEELIGLK